MGFDDKTNKNAVSGAEIAVDARENAVSGDEAQEKVVQERYIETVSKVGFVPKTLWQIDEMEDITEEEREDLRKAYFVNKMKMTEQEKYLIRMLRANPELFAPTAELIKRMLEEDEVYKLYNENEQNHDNDDE